MVIPKDRPHPSNFKVEFGECTGAWYTGKQKKIGVENAATLWNLVISTPLHWTLS